MNERPESERAEQIAGELADGASLDWADLRSSSPVLGSTLQRLEEIERIARFHERVGRDDPVPRGEPWGPLVLLGQIAEGAFGRVDRAFDPTLHREVALKRARVRSPGSSDRLLAEARRLARVRHPNVVAVYGAAQVGDETGIWMEPLSGRTLETRLHEDGPFQSGAALEIGRGLACALAAIHTVGLVHGDVKASNVIEDETGRIVLIDFGSVRNLDRSDLPFPSGTPLVLAPEVIEGADISVASDLYALGVLLFRLLSGRHPIEAEDMRTLVEAHRSGRRSTLAELRDDVPPALVGWVDALLEPTREARPADAGEVAARLDSLTTRTPRAGEADELRSPPRRRSRTSGPPWDELPTTTDRFVGRGSLLDEVTSGLENGAAVTLVAPGGWGKSRLALETARRLRLRREDGVVWIDLRGTQGAAFWGAVLAALGSEDRCPDPRELVIERLHGREVLVVVDNAESCPAESVRLVRDLLEAERNGSIWLLFTSREALGYPAESVVLVPPMSSGPGPIDESLELLTDRIRARAPGRDLSASNVALGDICRLTGGIPLGLELAASQSDLMSPEEIVRGLTRRVSADSPHDPRWRRLEPCLAWSYERLTNEAQSLLRHLSVWSRAFRLDDAAVALRVEDLWQAASSLRELVERGFAYPEGSVPRGVSEVQEYRLAEPVRRFARERLAERDEELGALSLHADRFLELCSSLPNWPAESGRPAPGWLGRTHNDLVDAWRHCLSEGRWKDAADLCTSLVPHWTEGSRGLEAEAVLEETIAAGRRESLREGRLVRLQLLLGGVKQTLRRHAEAARANEAGTALAAELEERGLEAFGLSRVAGSEILLGQPDSARERLERALAIAEHVAEPWLLGNVQNNLGLLHQRTGDLPTARRWYERAAASKKRTGDLRGEVVSLVGLAAIAWEEHDLDRARQCLTRALELQDSVPDARGSALLLFNFGNIEATAGDAAEAVARWSEALQRLEQAPEPILRAKCQSSIALHDENASSSSARQRCAEALELLVDRDPGAVPDLLESYATQLVRESRIEDAVRLYGAAHTLRDRSGLELPQAVRERHEAEVRALEEQGCSFQESWRKGELDPEAMVRWTLDDASRGA